MEMEWIDFIFYVLYFKSCRGVEFVQLKQCNDTPIYLPIFLILVFRDVNEFSSDLTAN